MKIKVAQVIGLNTDQKAAQAIYTSRNGENYFFGVMLLTSDDAFTKGRQVLSELSDFYFDLEEGSDSEKLKATFEEAKSKLPSLEFDLLLSSISGKVLYLIFTGAMEVHLKRIDKLSQLLAVGVPHQLISGFLQEGDRLLLATSTLSAFLGEDLPRSLNLPMSSFEQEVTDRIGASNLENQGLAALLVDVEEEEEVKLPNLQQEESAPSQPMDEMSPSQYESKINPQLVIHRALSGLLSILGALKRYFPKSGRGRLILAVVLIVVIALGVGFKIKASQDAKRDADFNQAIQSAREDFNAAQGLATLNPQEAKSKLDSAKSKIEAALSLKPQDSSAQDFKKQIEEQSPQILQQSSVSEFPVFLDLDLVKKNFRANHMSLSAGKLLLLDETVKTLISIDVAKKSNQILAGSEQLGEATAASLNGALAFVYSKDKGVVRVDTQSQKVSQAVKTDEEWGQILDLAGFASNFYLLDTGKNMIWKYLPTQDGYSSKREYLNKNTQADFGSAVRMQIESSIYVLKKDGEMLRFTRGDKDNFAYEGLDQGIKDPKSLYVASDTDNLYLLDSGNSRLVILTKTGAYKGQITGDKFAQVTDLVVDEKGKKVYLLEGSKIFEVELK